MTTPRASPAFHCSKGTGGVSTIGLASLRQVNPEPGKITRDDQTMRPSHLIHQPPGGSRTGDVTAHLPQRVDTQVIAALNNRARRNAGPHL